jgi:hypothetical protein
MRPDTSGSIGSWDRRGRTLRTSISLVVISFAALIGTADAQYLPPQEPPGGYPPPAYYPYRGYPPPRTMGIGVIHHLRTIGPIPPRRIRALIRTQMGRRTTMIMTDLTPHNQGLAVRRARRVASDWSR